QQMTHPAQQAAIIWAVVTPAATALHRLDFVETAFPEAQHVLRQIEFIRHFADGAKRIRRLVIQSGPLLGLETYAVYANSDGLGRFASAIVDALLENRRRLEDHNPPRRNRHFLTRLGVTPDSLALFTHYKRAKRRKFDGFPTF